MGRLLISVRGPNEALAAAKGGAHIADVEYPASALGTPYPLNIKAVRGRLDSESFKGVPISTNIGEDQPRRSTACQAALGVALAGADYIKCGLAGSVTRDDLPDLWSTGVDVICVRAAACEPRAGLERFGEVRADIVAALIATLPRS